MQQCNNSSMWYCIRKFHQWVLHRQPTKKRINLSLLNELKKNCKIGTSKVDYSLVKLYTGAYHVHTNVQLGFSSVASWAIKKSKCKTELCIVLILTIWSHNFMTLHLNYAFFNQHQYAYTKMPSLLLLRSRNITLSHCDGQIVILTLLKMAPDGTFHPWLYFNCLDSVKQLVY